MRQQVPDKGFTSELTMITSPRLKLKNSADVKSNLVEGLRRSLSQLNQLLLFRQWKISVPIFERNVEN